MFRTRICSTIADKAIYFLCAGKVRCGVAVRGCPFYSRCISMAAEDI